MIDMSQEGYRADSASSMAQYVQLKEHLLRVIDTLLRIDQMGHFSCRDLREKVEANTFNLVVVGQFKRGKTFLINALLGAEILPVSVVPLTSIATILVYGDSVTAKAYFKDGTSFDVRPEELSEYVTESGNPKNAKNVTKVVITYPSSYLKDGVRLIDTPGVGSVYQHNTDVAYRYLPQCDAALFLLSVEQPVSKAELDFLRDVQQYSNRIFFLLNKIDTLTEEEFKQSLEFSRQAVADAAGAEVKIFPVSARFALSGKLTGSDELLAKSNLPAFSEILNSFLLNEKGKILVISVANNLLRMLSQARLEAELELKSLTAPLDELRAKIGQFEDKKRQILLAKQEFEILIDGEIEKLVRAILDADLAALKRDLTPQIEERFDAFCEENRHLILKDLSDALNGFVTDAVQQALTGWQAIENDKIRNAFEGTSSRFLGTINSTVEDLLTFSSQLFTVRFETVEVHSHWKMESALYYKFSEEPVGLDMLDSSVTEVLPGYVGKRFQKLRDFMLRLANRRITKKARQRISQSIEMQAGRMRYDFIERLEASKLDLRSEMLKRIESTIAGIERAVEKGMDQRSRGEAEVEARQAALSEELAVMDAVKQELSAIIDKADRP